ncbi:MAG TPA: efflux RND transporter periplasmic adaptor subunit [Dyadobacter sp.]|jgi:RND family efflux transporter MFP subunit|nr:efflux RND transporter periplasmic adaptor subunit [Dyadobacter sp.]
MNITLKRSALPLLVSGVLIACGQKQEEKPKVIAPVKVTVQQINAGSEAEQLRYSGTIEAENQVQLGFAVPGTVASVLVNEGQVVSAGQLLAVLDPTEYDNALLIAAAGLEQAEDMYTRLNGLYEKGSLPAKDYIDIKSKLAQAKANRNLSLKRVKDTKLYASMSGIITSKNIEKGAMAAPGAPAFTIINTSKVYARVSVPESEIGKINKGQSANVSIATIGQELTGKIAIINPMADAATKSYSVKIQLPNGQGKILPGMIADAEIATGQSVDAITVPTKAVIRDADDITYVYVANGENKVTRKRITASGLKGDDVVISNGLQSGDRVVVSGQTKLKDGATVSL